MKLWVAKREYDHDGFVIIGIFSAENVARAACENDQGVEGGLRGDSHSVDEFTLNVKVAS